MQQALFDSCRHSVAEATAEHFGILGHSACPAAGGCYIPEQRPELTSIFMAVEGLEFPDFRNKISIGDLPKVVRTIPGDSPLPFDVGLLDPMVATRYTQIGGLRTKKIDFGKVSGWPMKRRVPDHIRVLLLQESKDKLLESLSIATLRQEFFPALAKLGNVVLVSPGYSVYDIGVMCEWLQLLNMKRSIFFAYLANLYSLPCIPCIAWNRHRPRDLERLADWLARQGDKVTHLAVNAQTGGPLLWDALSHGMAYLEEATGRTYHWLVIGGTSSVSVVYSWFPENRVTLVSASVATYTLKHRLIGQSKTSDLSADELLRQNIEREDWRREVAGMVRPDYTTGIRLQ